MNFKEKIKMLMERKKKNKMKNKKMKKMDESSKSEKTSIAQKINFGGKYKTKS